LRKEQRCLIKALKAFSLAFSCLNLAVGEQGGGIENETM